MSNHVSGILRKKKIGHGGTVKAVALLMAEFASDDGSGIWASKQHIADDLEITKRSVQNAIAKLVEAGLIREVGTSKCKNGFTYEYDMNMHAISMLPSVKDRGEPDSPVKHVHLTDETRSPHGVNDVHPNHTRTILEPNGLFDLPEQAETAENGFDSFWAKYPRKVKKKDAKARWDKITKKTDPKLIMAKLEQSLPEMRKTEDRFIPHPTSWLNSEPWQDGTPKAPAQKSSTDQLKDIALCIRIGSVGDITKQMAMACVEAGLVSAETCRKKGLLV